MLQMSEYVSDGCQVASIYWRNAPYDLLLGNSNVCSQGGGVYQFGEQEELSMHYCLTSTLLLACLPSQQLTRLLVQTALAAPSPARFCLLSWSNALCNTTLTKKTILFWITDQALWFIIQIYPELHFKCSLLASEMMHLWNLDRSSTGPSQHYHGAQWNETEPIKAPINEITNQWSLWSEEHNLNMLQCGIGKTKGHKTDNPTSGTWNFQNHITHMQETGKDWGFEDGSNLRRRFTLSHRWKRVSYERKM
jgi:hypothetical protein